MEIARSKIFVLLIFLLFACTNSSEFKKSETDLLTLFEKFSEEPAKVKIMLDAREVVSRAMIDQAKVPLLFVELETGQNGTLSKYPGEGVSSITWIGVDGATITLQNGLLLATRGMGHDLMGGNTSIKIQWSNLEKEIFYQRNFSYLIEGNSLSIQSFNCSMLKNKTGVVVENFDVKFITTLFEEKCSNEDFAFKNEYFVDKNDIVRRANVFHSQVIGSIYIERLDR